MRAGRARRTLHGGGSNTSPRTRIPGNSAAPEPVPAPAPPRLDVAPTISPGGTLARRLAMRPETIAIHGGFDADPATKAVAVPIYQTASYAFDSAAHGAALFDLEVEGYRYTRIANPTTAVLA